MAAELSASAHRVVRGARRALVITFVIYALANCAQLYDYSMYYRSNTWAVVATALFPALAIALYSPWTWLRATASYLGGFLIAQALVTPLVRDLDYIALEPNFSEVLDVQGDGMPGIDGLQRITTDAKGFRTTKPVDYTRAAPMRIFTIGGSTTEEIHHDDHATWSALLGDNLAQRLGQPVEVINTGVSGLRSPNHLSTLEQILPYHPNAAIFLLGANDWNCHIRRALSFGDPDLRVPFWLLETIRRLRTISLRESLLGDFLRRTTRGTLYKRNSTLGSSKAPRIERGEYYTKQNHSLSRPKQMTFHPDHVDPIFAAYLDRITDTCQRAQIRCIFVTQPNGYRPTTDEAYRRRFWMTPPNADYTLDLASLEYIATLYNNHLTAVGRNRGVPVCDAASQIDATFQFFYDELHLNLAGAQRMATVLAPCVAVALPQQPRVAVGAGVDSP